MKTWMKLLAVAASMLGLAVADEVASHVCDIDDPDIDENRAVLLAVEKFHPCFKDPLTEEMIAELMAAKTLGEYRNFTKQFCTKVPQVVSCMAGVRASFTPCQNKNVSLAATIASDLAEQLLPAACEHDGKRLGYIFHGESLIKMKTNIPIPLRRCIHKTNAYMSLIANAEIDLVSESYLLHNEVAKYKKCLKYVEDEAYKVHAEWLVNEVIDKARCSNGEGDNLIPCKDIDVTKVVVSSICDLEPLNDPKLYDHLEESTISCYSPVFSHDQKENTNYTDLEWLKEVYGVECFIHQDLPACLLEKTAWAEACLTQDEEKQFQLFAHTMEDFVKRSCIEEGVRMADIMHAVYQRTPEHGHALRDCHKTVMEARKSHEGHTVSSKNMRFYHEMIASKECVVEKLHDNNDVSQGMENMINDVLKKMECVNPGDGRAVLCETIHQH